MYEQEIGTGPEKPDEVKVYALLREADQESLKRVAEKLSYTELRRLDPKVLATALGGFISGRDWVLNKIGHDQIPPTLIGRFYSREREEEPTGVIRTSYGPIILLQTSKLMSLAEFRGDQIPQIRVSSQIGVVQSKTSLVQSYGTLGVEETTHYLQALEKYNLVHLPPPGKVLTHTKAGSIEYSLQEHELEALHYCGMYFQEVYGHNPYHKQELQLHLIGTLRNLIGKKEKHQPSPL